MYEQKLTDEKAGRLANSLGYSDKKLTNWVRGTSKSNYTTPEEVELIHFESDSQGFEIETEWYYADYDITYTNGMPGYALDRIEEKVWGIHVRSMLFEDDMEDLPIDEIALEAIEIWAQDVFKEEWC